MDTEASVKALALNISSCSEVQNAISDTSHPCHKVVTWQAKQWLPEIKTIESSHMHRPEAWTGKLDLAPIMFLSSNPSFNAKENFPNWSKSEWNVERVIDFAVNRFTSDPKREYGATQCGELVNLDRTIEHDGAISAKRVRYWSWVRQLVGFILEKPEIEISAVSDYVMTEIVHCKSTYEEGVVDARKKCKDKYLDQVLNLSPAKIIFVVGKNAAQDMSSIFPGKFPREWSEIAGGFWPKTNRDFQSIVKRGSWTLAEQMKHSVDVEIGGTVRRIVYFAKPGGGGGLCAPWKNPDLIDPDLLASWRQLVKDT